MATSANFLDQIIAFEQGEMSEDETLDFFQDMINAGTVWELQGFYQRTAIRFIQQGLCTLPERRAQ